jgi:8-oxo-dGTP pyrophosphatase MutT (NUDIX family)
MKTSAGIIITDGKYILGCVPFGKAKKTNNFLDLPKGNIEENESPIQAAIRECEEETGLKFKKSDLKDVGKFSYKLDKDLHLFLTMVNKMPSIDDLKCKSMVSMYGKKFPEMVGYEVIKISEIDEYFFLDLVKILKELI